MAAVSGRSQRTGRASAPSSFHPSGGWGAAGHRAALSITFDNFGEAAEVELGLWGDRPVGAHPSVAFLPRLVAALDGVRATYFIEASNAGVYPDAIRAWHQAGQEVALHAWHHEIWAGCPAGVRRELLARSVAAMRGLGIEPVGFRPPGGTIPGDAWAEFAEAGLLYCSEAGQATVGRVDGVISLPFEWRGVDVYMIEEVLGFMRVRHGDPEAAFSIADWRSSLEATVQAALAEGGHRTVIFHPNLLATSEDKLDVLRGLIASARRNDVWIAPACDVARFVAAAPPADWREHGAATAA